MDTSPVARYAWTLCLIVCSGCVSIHEGVVEGDSHAAHLSENVCDFFPADVESFYRNERNPGSLAPIDVVALGAVEFDKVLFSDRISCRENREKARISVYFYEYTRTSGITNTYKAVSYVAAPFIVVFSGGTVPFYFYRDFFLCIEAVSGEGESATGKSLGRLKSVENLWGHSEQSVANESHEKKELLIKLTKAAWYQLLLSKQQHGPALPCKEEFELMLEHD